MGVEGRGWKISQCMQWYGVNMVFGLVGGWGEGGMRMRMMDEWMHACINVRNDEMDEMDEMAGNE